MSTYTQDQLTALRDAYARGVLEAVLPDGSRIRYRSAEDMERIMVKMETSIGVRSPNQNVTYPTHSRGFDSE